MNSLEERADCDKTQWVPVYGLAKIWIAEHKEEPCITDTSGPLNKYAAFGAVMYHYATSSILISFAIGGVYTLLERLS